MRFETFFALDGDLILIEGIVVGPRGHTPVSLLLDTAASLTTLVPEIAEVLGYTVDDRVARSVVRTAVGEERGYIVRLPTVVMLGIRLRDVHVNIADLGHGIDGLLGINVLSEFNFEVRYSERRILAELSAG